MSGVNFTYAPKYVKRSLIYGVVAVHDLTLVIQTGQFQFTLFAFSFGSTQNHNGIAFIELI